MSDYEDMESYQDYAEEQDWQDHQLTLFYEYLIDLKEGCRPPRTYNLPADLTKINTFWRIGE